MNRLTAALAVCGALTFSMDQCNAGILIDFESPYFAEWAWVSDILGVSFTNAQAIEQGGNLGAFMSSAGYDTGLEAPFSETGNTFVYSRGSGVTLTMDFTSYSSGVNDVSFRLVDIDDADVFTAIALGQDMSVLETIVLSYPDGDPGTGDGVVTTISFAVSDVFFVRTVVTNPNNSTPGFGIDNIQFTDAQFATVPEPCGLVVWAVLGAAIIPWWRRRMPRPG